MRRTLLADLGIPDEVVEHMALVPRFDGRDAQRALEGSGHRGAAARDATRAKLWDYWERNLDPDLFKDRSFAGAVNGKTVVITGASSGIGRAAALKVARGGRDPAARRPHAEKLDEVKTEIEATGGTAYAYTADLSDYDSIDAARGEDLRRPRLDRRARQQRGALDPPLASRSPTTASTTSSGRSSSTTSARSS